MRGKAGVLGRPVVTSLLLHFDGSNGGTTFTDSSVFGHAITRDGDAEISTAQSKFGGASGYFDGTGDGLQVPTDPSLDLKDGDFTIEAWIYPTSVSGSRWVCGRMGDADYAFFLQLTSGAPEFFYYAEGESGIFDVTGSALTVNQWAHVAVVKNGTSLRLYVDGVQQDEVEASIAMNPSSENIFIGREPPTAPTAQDDFAGYLDEFRISRTAVYTTAFTPPTAAF